MKSKASTIDSAGFKHISDEVISPLSPQAQKAIELFYKEQLKKDKKNVKR